MSAFLCSDTQTYAAALITLGVSGSTVVGHAEVREVARQYRALNNYALKARYNDEGQPLLSGDADLRKAIEWVRKHSAADCYQVLRCLRYQCSEGDCEKQPGWKTLTDACGAVQARAGATASDVWSIY